MLNVSYRELCLASVGGSFNVWLVNTYILGNLRVGYMESITSSLGQILDKPYEHSGSLIFG